MMYLQSVSGCMVCCEFERVFLDCLSQVQVLGDKSLEEKWTIFSASLALPEGLGSFRFPIGGSN